MKKTVKSIQNTQKNTMRKTEHGRVIRVCMKPSNSFLKIEKKKEKTKTLCKPLSTPLSRPEAIEVDNKVLQRQKTKKDKKTLMIKFQRIEF